MSSITRVLSLILLLPFIITSATPIDDDVHLGDRGDPCAKIRDIVEALNKLPQPWKLYQDRITPHTTTIKVTSTPVVTDYKYTTVTQDVPGCMPLNRRRDALGLDDLPDIMQRDPGIQLPPALKKWGLQKVQEACRCLPKRPKQTVTTTVVAQPSVRFPAIRVTWQVESY
ncbi:hypothetical protein B0T11DRAFT_331784 [Plectosphaerella cucumerina]|uniref:Secreted protein n=1 Tax=Plectosphaerella cucumerina TaxID=40658 RepID=A0A8K0X153_9PEZI|nr:hypothetical protein B0T11DRAFT_331784 [Plectosphaerella cucumerina]